MADVVHQLITHPASGRAPVPTGPVHQLARQTGYSTNGKVPPDTVWARCGLRVQLVRPALGLRGAPAVFTASWSRVTCEQCANPPSWADAGIPT